MSLKIIVSYDDTDNDRDALALGRLLAISGAELSLAYVRHSVGGALEQKEAEELLARGAASVGAPDMARHVVVNAGTSLGLGSWPSARTPTSSSSAPSTAPRRARSGRDGRPTNCCSTGRRRSPSPRPGCSSNPSVSINTVGVLDSGDPAARQTAASLAAALGAGVAEHGSGPVDFLVVGSRPEAHPGKVTISAASDYAIETATSPGAGRAAGEWCSASGRLRPRSPDDEDHGRDLRVAAVEPLPRLGPVDRPAVVPGDHVRGDRLRRVRFDHEGVGHDRRRCLGEDARG